MSMWALRPGGARGRLRACVAAVVLAAGGCTTLPAPPVVQGEGCDTWLAALDAAVADAGVADAEAERIEGLPGLRVDRIAEALRETARAGGDAWRAWLARAAAADAQARAAELANLPAAAFPIGPPVRRAGHGAAAREHTESCRARLLGQLTAAPPPLRAAVLERAEVPQRYHIALRAAGLYPLLRWPFFAGVQRWQEDHEAEMRRWALAPPALERWVPAADLADGAESAFATPDATAVAARDALGLPQPAPSQAQRLLAWHAPVFEIEQRGPFDRFGVPAWDALDAAAPPRVDTAQPVVYTRLAHTRFEGRWLVQLVYTLWFPERPARSSLDLLAGALDGVIVRLTLDDDGQPLVMDTIHACGCYHLFFASPSLQPRGAAPRHEEWLFAPAPLPALGERGHGQRLVVRLASGTHYVSGLAALPRVPAGHAERTAVPRRYVLRDENELRSLPLPAPPGSGAERRSLYGPDGLIAGSERGERFLFWPMGIASAGAMRQWGHHATAFVGRRHFDEVDLIERRFERAAAPALTPDRAPVPVPSSRPEP